MALWEPLLLLLRTHAAMLREATPAARHTLARLTSLLRNGCYGGALSAGCAPCMCTACTCGMWHVHVACSMWHVACALHVHAHVHVQHVHGMCMCMCMCMWHVACGM